VVLFIAHGVNGRTTTAVLGTLTSLGLVGLLGVLGIHFVHLTGLSSEENSYLQAVTTVRLGGLLLAGMVIGALGVLNDVTVTQASAVWEIHGAHPTDNAVSLYRAGMRVGRDHIASTVYTLVLAYTGAALPLLLLFNLGHAGFSQVVTSEVVAEEVVRTIIGSIGLLACVPLTTALAAVVVTAAARSDRGSSTLDELDPVAERVGDERARDALLPLDPMARPPHATGDIGEAPDAERGME
jgi:uncharacterized membrane protein